MSKLTRKTFLKGLTSIGLAATVPGCVLSKTVEPARKRPNVLFVMTDEWRAQAFGYMGDVNVHTPVIDQFYREAISFRQAVAGTPVCCPARASWITGQYPLTHGVYINDVPLEPKGVTFGQAFADAGYKTGYIGKWHLYGSPEGRNERRLDYIPPEKRFGFHYWKAAECTHDYNNSIYYEGNDPAPKYWQGYDAVAQTNDAVRFISEHARAADPYCLVLSLGPPHFPYSAPEQYNRLYESRELVLRPNVPGAAREKALTELRGYYASIAVLDDCFARLMKTVEVLGAEDTIVVLASDHGEMAYSHGLAYKLYPWEESIRVPFMVRYPREFGRKQRHTDAMFDSPDIMPTMLGLAGIPVPEGIEGTDYSTLLRGGETKGLPETAFLSLPVPITSARTYGIGAYRGVRDVRYTYVRSAREPWLLYDNERDPYQKKNLINDRALANVQSRLERDLQAWLERLRDEFLPPELYLEQDGLSHYIETQWPVGQYQSPWGDWQSTLDVPSDQPRSIDATLKSLYADSAAATILDKIVPSVRAIPLTGMVGTMSPRALSALRPSSIPPQLFRELRHALQQLPRTDESE